MSLSETSSLVNDQPGSVWCSASSAGFAGATSGLLASDARGPARGRPAARTAGLLASDARGPARGRPAARTASWGKVRKRAKPPPSFSADGGDDLLAEESNGLEHVRRRHAGEVEAHDQVGDAELVPV